MRDKNLASDKNLSLNESAAEKDPESCYERTAMQKEIIVQRLRENGCRITRQRKMLLDIILQEECSCCKEIYYRALKEDAGIGAATVYRMINTLEDIGALSRRNMYRVSCGDVTCEHVSRGEITEDPCGNLCREGCCDRACQTAATCTVELDDGSMVRLNGEEWRRVVWEGLRACGYIDSQKIKNIVADSFA